MLALLALLLTPPVPAPSPTPRPQPAALEGRVLGPGERPLEGALVLAGRPGEAPRQARTDTRGAFRIPLLDSRPVALRAEAPGLAPAELAAARPGTPLVVRLGPGLVLAGTVRDAQGEPIAGARLELFLERATLGGSGGAPLREAATNPAGAFRLAALPAGPFTLAVRARGFGDVRLRRLLADRPLDVVLARGAWLTGLVRDERGRPLAAASVRLASEVAGEPGRTQTDGAGRFALPFPGRDSPMRVVARGADSAPALSPRLTSPDAAVDLVLPRGARVTGRVVDETGRPLACQLELLELDGVPSRALGELVHAEAGPDGRFVLVRLPPGRHALNVAARGRVPQRASVEIGNGSEQDLGDLALEAGLVLAGRIRDPQGRPVALARVAASHDDENTVRTVTTESEPDGRFRIAGLPAGEVRLRVEAPGFAAARASASAGGAPIEITLHPGGSLLGMVVDDADRPVDSFTLEAETSGGRRSGDESLRRDVMAPDGRFLVEDVAPGRYTVVISAPERAPATLSAVEVEPGRSTDLGRIRLGTGLGLRVRVTSSTGSPLAGASVRAVRGAGLSLEWSGAREGRTDLGGGLELSGLAPGSYLVTASHPERVPGEAGPVELEAERATPEVRLVLGEGGRVEGTVQRRGTPLPGARVDVRSSGSSLGSFASTVTDGEGHFEVAQVRPGPARVDLMEPGPAGASSVIGARLEVREGETSRADLELREVLLQGRVTRGGEPLAGARIEIRQPDAGALFGGGAAGPDPVRQYHRARSGPDGGFELLLASPGHHLVRVEAVDGGGLPVREVEVPDVDTFALVLDLPAAGVRLSGTVLDADSGAPVGDAGVTASPLLHEGQRAAHGRSGSDGSFALEVDPGPYRLRAGARGHQSRSADVIVGDAGLANLRLSLPAGQSLRGRVVDASGTGAAGLEVMATAPGSSGYAITQADGGFEMEGLAGVPHALGSASRDGRFAFAVLSPAEEDVTLALRPGGRVALEVLGPDGEPLADALASVTKLGGMPAEFPELWGETDLAGRVERPVPAGRVELAVEARGLRGRVTVDVPEGALAAARLRLEPAGDGR
jgi:protocatechuate 3,4-dioxygenase beta subunit